MIKPAVLDAMVLAGCSAAQIAAAVKADQSSSSGAERQARFRAKQKALLSDERNVTSVTVTDEVPPKKETSPTPPKEKTTPSTFSEANASSNETRASFDDFWSLFPNKVGKRDAEREFGLALKRAPFADIMAGLRRYVAKTDDRAWCNPSTFLHQDRWSDQPAAVQTRSTSRQAGVSGAAQRIIESENNGSESLFGNHGDAQRIPSTSGSGPRNAASDLPGGIGRQFVTINH